MVLCCLHASLFGQLLLLDCRHYYPIKPHCSIWHEMRHRCLRASALRLTKQISRDETLRDSSRRKLPVVALRVSHGAKGREVGAVSIALSRSAPAVALLVVVFVGVVVVVV